MLTLRLAVLALALAGSGLAVVLLTRARRRPGPGFHPEDYLLEEAQVIAPIAPGMTGKVELRASGASRELLARAEDPAQAFERGARVQLIDYRDGAYLVEPADEEHLVR